MAIEHNVIPDGERHEPKDIDGSSVGEVYVSDGTGSGASGAWQPIIPVGGDTALAGQVFVSNGAGGGSWDHRTDIHGEMFVTGNTTPAVLTAAVDPTLSTDTDYVKATTGWQAGHLTGINFNTDELEITVAGDYEINLWASFEIAVTNSLIGVKYAINNTIPYSPRKILNKAKTTTDINNLFGIGIAPGLQVGDVISIYIASDTNTNVTGREVGVTMKLLHEN